MAFLMPSLRRPNREGFFFGSGDLDAVTGVRGKVWSVGVVPYRSLCQEMQMRRIERRLLWQLKRLGDYRFGGA